MRLPEWGEERRHPERLHPELEFPMAYHIPYEWGVLQVSKEAREDYGLIPLTAEMRLGPWAEQASKNPKLNICLLGTREMFEQPESPEMIRSRILTHRKGATIKAAFGNDTEGLKKFRVEYLQNELKSGDYMPDISPEITDSIEYSAPQIFAHTMAGVLAKRSSEAMKTILMERNHKRILKAMKGMGLYALGSAGVQLVPDAIEETDFGADDALFPLLTTGILIGYAYHSLKGYLRSLPALQRAAEASAAVGSAQVFEDIHLSFCRKHFDEKLERQIASE